MPSVLVAHGVTYDLCTGRRLFDRLNLSLPSGVTGLVGANGIGKSCLARILAGELQPTSGYVQSTSEARLLPQREPPASTTVKKYLGMPLTSSAGLALLDGIGLESRCNALSGGQWMRVRLAKVFGDSLLILDEPTNDLDSEARAVVTRLLRARAGATLLISHDRETLEHCTQILELSNRGLESYSGGWSAYESARAAESTRRQDVLDRARRDRDLMRAKEREAEQNRSRRLQHARSSAARGGLPKLSLGMRKRNAQATSGRKKSLAIRMTEETVQSARTAFEALKIQPVMYAGIAGIEPPARKLVAEASGFNVFRGRWIYPKDLDFCWRGNQRVAIQGCNGSGKSSLLQLVRGVSYASRGQLRVGALTSVFLDQHHSDLCDELSVLQSVKDACTGEEGELRQVLARFLFRGDSVHQSVGTLSGGERLRLALARAFMRVGSPELMLLDEPTNNLDALNVEFLEELIRGFDGALVVISHDDKFLGKCGITREYRIPM